MLKKHLQVKVKEILETRKAEFVANLKLVVSVKAAGIAKRGLGKAFRGGGLV
jgi:hypothetical protein